MSHDYLNQQDGTNQYGVPYIAGQNLGNAVMHADDPQNDRTVVDLNAPETADDGVADLAAVLAALGLSSLEELRAAAGNL